MIRADKRGPLAWAWARYLDAKVRGAFRGVWVRGELPAPDERGLLVYCNHVGFWDGLMAHALSRAAGWDGYCAMEEQNLARYRFLRRAGAFSVRRGDPSSALETLRYARRLLQRPGAAVFIFPEGELRPAATDLGPLERGVEVLARASGARCLPVALRYAFFEAERPDALLEVGAAHPPERLDGLRQRLEALVDRVTAARGVGGYSPLVRGSLGTAERWDALRSRAGQGG